VATIEINLKCYRPTCSLTTATIEVPDEDRSRPPPDEQSPPSLIKSYYVRCQYCDNWNKIQIWNTWNSESDSPILADQGDSWDGVRVFHGERSSGPPADMADQTEGSGPPADMADQTEGLDDEQR
jgi:hypothetical protein